MQLLYLVNCVPKRLCIVYKLCLYLSYETHLSLRLFELLSNHQFALFPKARCQAMVARQLAWRGRLTVAHVVAREASNIWACCTIQRRGRSLLHGFQEGLARPVTGQEARRACHPASSFLHSGGAEQARVCRDHRDGQALLLAPLAQLQCVQDVGQLGLTQRAPSGVPNLAVEPVQANPTRFDHPVIPIGEVVQAAGDVDDAPVSSLPRSARRSHQHIQQQVGQEVVREMIHGELQLVAVDTPHEPAGHDGGVVDESVQRQASLQKRFGKRAHRRQGAHVALHGGHLARWERRRRRGCWGFKCTLTRRRPRCLMRMCIVRWVQVPAQALGLGLSSTNGNDVRAPRAQHLRQLPPQATRRASDDHHLALQITVSQHLLPSGG
mmetsp:Transcript_1801/g.3753  ORF Transcript_1801/g.3753 Transcript_1801/m.3753 type:complete len:381 (+) Transcript_1801:1188-2330(+)